MKGLYNIVFLMFALFFTSNLLFAAGNAEEAEGSREFTIGLDVVPDSIYYRAIEKFRDHIREARPDIDIIIYPSNQLGDHRAMTAQMRAGELDFQHLAFPNLSYVIPELRLIGEPYVVEDFEQLKKVIAGSYGQEISKKFAALGIKMLDTGYAGSRQTTSNVAIESIDDMAGLKIRVPDVDFLLDYATAVKAIPSPLSFHEVYLALQTNQVDAQENPLPTIYTMKFYEVQDYIAMTNHYIGSGSIFINLDLWNSLTAEEQKLVQEAATIATDYQSQEVMKVEAEMTEILKAQGVTFTYPDIEPFRAAMQPYYDKLEDEFGAGSISDLINY